MHIVQLLLPLYDNEGLPFPDSVMAAIRDELVARFGGVTAFSRTPAEGVWSDRGQNIRDEVILVEVMVENLDLAWWSGFRGRLESLLRQRSLVARAFAITRL